MRGSLPVHSPMKGVFYMCGISGFCDFSKNFKKGTRPLGKILHTDMHHTLAHRGSDSFGTYLDTHVGLSHARLSIRDIAGGSQPMIRQDGGRTCAIVYNGEIYNTDELLPPLLAAGYTFSTTSDTEVILCAYLHYGRDFVRRLNGIFAFVIWDGRTGELLLYRDRAGTKPLFYRTPGGALVFGSEPKALFCHPDITPAIDENSLLELLSTPASGAHTRQRHFFRHARSFFPGHYQIFSRRAWSRCATGILPPPRTPIPMKKRWRWSLIWCAMP